MLNTQPYPFFIVQGARIADQDAAIERAVAIARETDRPVDVYIRRSRFATNMKAAFFTVLPQFAAVIAENVEHAGNR